MNFIQITNSLINGVVYFYVKNKPAVISQFWAVIGQKKFRKYPNILYPI